MMITASRMLRFLLWWLLLLLLAVGCLLTLFFFRVRGAFDGSAVLPAECAVVFGAAVRSRHDAGPGIRRRMGAAVTLYHRGDVRRLFLTGGKGNAEQQSEAAVMRSIALEEGVDPADIVLEEESRSTWENLRNTRPLTSSCPSVLAVSDRYHLARIGFLARLQGWDALRTYPADQIADAAFETQSVLREVLALLYYSLRSLISPAPG